MCQITSFLTPFGYVATMRTFLVLDGVAPYRITSRFTRNKGIESAQMDVLAKLSMNCNTDTFKALVAEGVDDRVRTRYCLFATHCLVIMGIMMQRVPLR